MLTPRSVSQHRTDHLRRLLVAATPSAGQDPNAAANGETRVSPPVGASGPKPQMQLAALASPPPAPLSAGAVARSHGLSWEDDPTPTTSRRFS